jgi:hypothetical protein
MAIQPARALAGETVELVVQVRIAAAHYLHARGAEQEPFTPVSLDLMLPAAAETEGDWQLPAPQRIDANSLGYFDRLVLRRRLRISSRARPQVLHVRGVLHYQACTAELCWPAATMQLAGSLEIPETKAR